MRFYKAFTRIIIKRRAYKINYSLQQDKHQIINVRLEVDLIRFDVKYDS